MSGFALWWRCGVCLTAIVTVGQSRAAEGVHTATPFLLSSVPFGAVGEPLHAANGIMKSKHRMIVNIHRVRIFIFISPSKIDLRKRPSGRLRKLV